jgi:hypothetical protein
MDAQETTPGPPPVTEEEKAQIQSGANALLQFFQADPGARAAMDRTIRQHLLGGVSLETWDRILGGLTRYAGEEVTRFLLMTLLSADQLLNPAGTEHLALVEQHVGPEAWSYLCGLMALYGDDLKESYELSGQNEQGWRTINRRVFYDHLSETWRATFEIIKFGGERVYLDETPTSAIVLCQAILDGLNAVPEEIAQEIADRYAIEDLVGLVYTFVERYAPDLLEEEV